MQGVYEGLKQEKITALHTATELKYKNKVIEEIKNAKSIAEIDQIMIQARHDWELEY